MSLLEISAADDESGAVVILSGEADATNVAELSAALTAQLAAGPSRLTVDVSGLRSADPAAIRAVVLAGLLLKDHGGQLRLVHPQPAVAQALNLLGVGQLIGARPGTGAAGRPASR